MNTILAPINNAVAWIITQLFNLFSPAFGVASGVTWVLTIVILVVLMRLILVPLFIKQMHTQRAMTALTPKIQEIRKKHKGDRETLNQETMKLYQEAGVNPLMGCLPVVLQLPIFFALFNVLRYIAEWHKGDPLQFHLTEKIITSAQHAKIFGATIADKVLFTGTPGQGGIAVPLHAKIVIVVVVLISMTTTYLTVRQSMKRGMMPTNQSGPMGQSQKLMAYIMPLFALTGLYWQFGLVLYWVTTNVWTLGQQWVLFRRYPQPAVAGAPAGGGTAPSPVIAPSATGRNTTKPPKRAAAAQADQSSSNGSAKKSASGGQSGNAGRKTTGAAASGTAGQGAQPSANGGGMLRRLGKRAEPEPAPPEPEVKLVRQQRQRQSRSKRSGKR